MCTPRTEEYPGAGRIQCYWGLIFFALCFLLFVPFTIFVLKQVQQIDRVVDVVEETLKGNKVSLLAPKRENGRKTGGANLNLPKIRKNPFVEIIPINTGCRIFSLITKKWINGFSSLII